MLSADIDMEKINSQALGGQHADGWAGPSDSRGPL